MRYIDNLISTLKKKDNGKLFNNFFSLFVLQVLNVVLPFLTIPYLITTLGMERYGLLSLGHAISLFFVIFVDYGFNTSITREISIHADNHQKVNQIFREVQTTKFFILACVFALFCIFIVVIPQLYSEALLYFLYFGIVVGYALFPQWLFHGLQQMKYITYVNVFFKSIFTLAIFVFVKDIQDIALVPLFLSLGMITSGIIALVIIHKKFQFSFRFTSFHSVTKQLKYGYHIFMSEFYMAIMAYANILILGFLMGNESVGIYSAAEKVIRAAAGLISPVINAIYPHVSSLFVESKKDAFSFIKKVRNYGVIILLSGIIIVFVLSDYLFLLLNDYKAFESLGQSVLVFRIMIIFPLFSFLDQIYGKLILIANGNVREFFRVCAVGAVLNVFLCIILSFSLDYIGAAIASAVSQMFVVVGMYYYAKPITNSSVKKV